MEMCTSTSLPGVVSMYLYLTLDNNGKQPLTNIPTITGLSSENIWSDIASKTSDKNSYLSFLTAVRKTYFNIKKLKAYYLCLW